MTKVSYIAGIGQDESAGRAAGIKPQPFIPYLSMTKGEMTLALLQEQAQILAGYYGLPKYKEAEVMLDNALYGGLHGSTPYLGAYSPELQQLAKIIRQASRMTQPAAGAILGRESMINGVHVGEIIPVQDRLKACTDAAKKLPGSQRLFAIPKCIRAARMEKILNDGLENCGQYLANGFLPKNNNLPQNANLKIYNQEVAQNDISRVGKFDLSLTQQWLNVGMMRRNVDTAHVGPLGWIDTNTALTMLPEAGQKEIIALFNSKTTWTSQAEAGKQLAAIVKKYQAMSDIGIPQAVAIAILGAITALIKGISEFAKQAKAEQADAFAQVNGFGTRPFGPEEGDWDSETPNEQDKTPTGEKTNYTTPLLIGWGLLGLYLLTK